MKLTKLPKPIQQVNQPAASIQVNKIIEGTIENAQQIVKTLQVASEKIISTVFKPPDNAVVTQTTDVNLLFNVPNNNMVTSNSSIERDPQNWIQSMTPPPLPGL